MIRAFKTPLISFTRLEALKVLDYDNMIATPFIFGISIGVPNQDRFNISPLLSVFLSIVFSLLSYFFGAILLFLMFEYFGSLEVSSALKKILGPTLFFSSGLTSTLLLFNVLFFIQKTKNRIKRNPFLIFCYLFIPLSVWVFPKGAIDISSSAFFSTYLLSWIVFVGFAIGSSLNNHAKLYLFNN